MTLALKGASEWGMCTVCSLCGQAGARLSAQLLRQGTASSAGAGLAAGSACDCSTVFKGQTPQHLPADWHSCGVRGACQLPVAPKSLLALPDH